MQSKTKLEILKDQIANIPESPGCYLWKNSEGKVIYVGKAKKLRSRMRQYLNFQDERLKIPLLLKDIYSFDYIVVKNENESLILEKNLINLHKPYYNADFKDDKSYPFIAVTKGDYFPSIKYTREKHKNSTKYFGPYTDSRAARKTIDILRRIIPICSYNCVTWKRLNKKILNIPTEKLNKMMFSEKPCFDSHVGIAPGACCGKIDQKSYLQNVKKVEHFLNGHQKNFIDNMRVDMIKAANNLNFEKAARIQQRIKIIESLQDKQNIVTNININADVVGFFREETIAGVHILIVREGRIINSNQFILNRGLDIENHELVHMFLLRYYDNTTSIPNIVILNDLPDDTKEMETWLTNKLNSKYKAKVKFEKPKKGNKYELLKMAEKNAKHSLLRYKVRTNYEDKRVNNALLQLETALAMQISPMRIECFDISTNHGSYTVASMVVFSGGRPDKNQYRRFKIKTQLRESNDFLCMQEVIKRRYTKERLYDKKFGKIPNLIILDGGKPQLTAALQIFKELEINLEQNNIYIVGLAKKDEELIVPWQLDNKNSISTIILPDGSEALFLVKQIRDEAHRFAIAFHRNLRNKGMTQSILDEVAGLGPVRKKNILKYFGSFKNVKNASLDDLINSKTIPNDVAKELFLILDQYSKKNR